MWRVYSPSKAGSAAARGIVPRLPGLDAMTTAMPASASAAKGTQSTVGPWPGGAPGSEHADEAESHVRRHGGWLSQEWISPTAATSGQVDDRFARFESRVTHADESLAVRSREDDDPVGFGILAIADAPRRGLRLVTDTRPLTLGLVLGVLATGVYGGYFGAAQGVVLLALLGILWSTDMHRANGAKNVLAGVANLVSAIIFITSGTVDWQIAILIGIGAATGGWLGSHIGRRLSAPVLRTILVVVAVVAAVVLFVT